MKSFFLLIYFVSITNVLFPQILPEVMRKPIIDSSVFSKWPSLGLASFSRDGNYVLYALENVPIGNQSLVIQSTHATWKRTIIGCSKANFSGNSRWVVYRTSGDSLCIFSIKQESRLYIPGVISYALPKNGEEAWLAYLVRKTDSENQLILRNLDNGQEKNLGPSGQYFFNDSGSVLAFNGGAGQDSNTVHSLHWLGLNDGEDKVIWQGVKQIVSYNFDETGNQLAFIEENSGGKKDSNVLWYYQSGLIKAEVVIHDGGLGIDSNMEICNETPMFNRDGKRIFFKLTERKVSKVSIEAVKMDVWHYKDNQVQSFQLLRDLWPKSFMAVVEVSSHRVLRLERDGEEICSTNHLEDDNNYIIVNQGGGRDTWWWTETSPSVWLVDIRDGSRQLVKKHIPYGYGWSASFDFQLSPKERYIVYYDPVERNYFSYEISMRTTRNITKGINVSWRNSLHDDLEPFLGVPVGIGGWVIEDRGVLVYDNYDIWEVDPAGLKKPVNITRGFGQAHNLKFRLANGEPIFDIVKELIPHASLLLSTFSPVTKWSGFYRKTLDDEGMPELLTMGPYNWRSMAPLKAQDAEAWLVKRMSAGEAPNYFVTSDFKSYRTISELQPQKAYNWLTAELVTWPLPDGTLSQGILYKPENFNLSKKYPIIFNYYERKSDGLFEYLEPAASRDNINIPYFVSKGYLVFLPDIYYRMGYTGESALRAVESAARYLSRKSWVDGNHMGIQGHSFGGYETNYIVTHSHLFAAAAEAAGPTDFISGYGGIRGEGISSQYLYEVLQNRLRFTLWQRPDLYISNSPVLKADQVRTPLLMMHNKGDGYVPFAQGMELFMALRRLGKRVWLLQYDEGGHNVLGKNAVDYTVRLNQFFDYYLKGALPPLWMTEGIPARLRGIQTRYSLDSSGKKP